MTVEPLPPELAYSRRSRVYPLVMIVLLALWLGPWLVIAGSSAISAAINTVVGPPQVVISNESTTPFVALLSADENPPPGATEDWQPPQFEFVITPRATSLLPRDHPWASVDILTPQCELATDFSYDPTLSTRVTIHPDGTVDQASTPTTSDTALPSIQATLTQACAGGVIDAPFPSAVP